MILALNGSRGPLQFQQPPEERGSTVVNFFRGLGYFFSRERPERVRVKSGLASAAVRGTEFVVQVDETQRLQIALLDGEVELTNSNGSINLRTGEQGIAEPGCPPFKTSVLDAAKVVPWLLY